MGVAVNPGLTAVARIFDSDRVGGSVSTASSPVLEGTRFGKLVVTEWVGRKRRDVPVRCDCGTETVTTRTHLRARARSRGCDRTYCECGKATIWRSARQLLTCGSVECAYRMRGQATGINLRGRRSKGGAARVEDPGYTGIHARARRVLRGELCALADDGTCVGRLEAALRLDADPAHLREVDGLTYSIDPEPLAAYRRLCRSHHSREGRAWAVRRQFPEIEGVIEGERGMQAVCDQLRLPYDPDDPRTTVSRVLSEISRLQGAAGSSDDPEAV